MPTAPRKPRTTARIPKPELPLGVVAIESKDAPDQVDTPVFAIDGKVYSMKTPLGVGISMAFVDIMRKEGASSAISWAMETTLGAEAFEALKTNRAVTTDHLRAITDRMRDLIMGPLEEPGKD